MDKVFRRQVLDKALTDAGIVSKSGAYIWLLEMEKKGRIVSPRDPVTGQRLFTQTQIEEIIKAFLPGGTGYWPSSLADKPKPAEKTSLPVESTSAPASPTIL